MSSSNGRALLREIKAYNRREKEGPPATLVEKAKAYLSRTRGIERWKNVSAYNRTTTHRTVALKFVSQVENLEE